MMARLIHCSDGEVVTLDYGASKVTNVLGQEPLTKGYLVWAFRFRSTIPDTRRQPFPTATAGDQSRARR